MIRFTFKCLKPVAIFLAIAFLFQCCKVYHKEPVSFDEALHSDIKRVKIITKDDRVFVFDSIYYVHDKLYGHLIAIKGKNLDEKVGVQINKENIKEIHLYDKKKSNRLTVLAVVGIPIGTFLIITAIAAIDLAINGFY